MSAIFGFILKDKIWQADSLVKAGNALKHRGNDHEWYALLSVENKINTYTNELPEPGLQTRLALGYRGLRLSPSELERPAQDQEAGILVAFDGVIYNRKELIGKLQLKEVPDDTSLILHCYKKWGIDFVKQLNGMFAIEISDLKNGRLYLIRDHNGTKPLYYYQSADTIIWASEIKGLLASGKIKGTLDLQGLLAVYYLQSPIPPATSFKNIYQMPPATWLSIDIHSLDSRLHRYWDIPFGETDRTLSFEAAGQELSERIRESVKRQTDTHARTVSLLSGGIDSTLITAFAHEFVPGLTSYTMALDGTGQGDDELPQAKAMADHLHIPQYVHWADADEILSNLDGDIRHLEEPFSDIEVFMNSSKYLGNKDYKIILNGAGADRLLGGDGYHSLFWKWRKIRRASPVAPFIPPLTPYLKRTKNFLSIKSVWQYFANSQASLRIYQLEELLKGSGIRIDIPSMLGREEHVFRKDTEALFYHDMLHLFAHHTWRMDLCGMRYGVEMRYPFLDHTLTEWVSKLPLAYRYNPERTKPLAREAVKKLVTSANLTMKKKGYRLPIETWLNKYGAIDAYLKDNIDKLKKRDIFNNQTIDRWWSDYQGNKFQFIKIWLLATTEVWMQTYIDQY